jgi:hypothetical protein
MNNNNNSKQTNNNMNKIKIINHDKIKNHETELPSAIPNRASEDDRLLWHDGYPLPERAEGNCPDIHAVDADASTLQRDQAEQRRREG